MLEMSKPHTAQATQAKPQATQAEHARYLKNKLGPRFDSDSLDRWLTIECRPGRKLNIEIMLNILQSIPIGEEASFFVNALPSPIEVLCSMCVTSYPPFEMFSFIACKHEPIVCNGCACEYVLVH